MKVIFLRSSSLALDPRANKETTSLAKNNYQVIVLAWDRENIFPPLETKDSGATIKRFKLPAPYGKTTVPLFLPLFWSWAILQLLILKPDIIHACDLDTAVPAYFYKLILKRKVYFIFDVFDRYAMAYVPQQHKILYDFVNLIEELFASKADILITVSERFLRTFQRFRIRSSVIIQNTPSREEIEKVIKKAKPNHNRNFRIYIPHITKETLVLKRAVDKIPNVEILITGRVMSSQIAREVLSSPHVKYFGITSHEKALEVENSADLIAIIYDPSVPLSQYRLAGCNRLFEAIMLKKPIITNIKDKIVVDKLSRCIIVDYDSKSITNAVTTVIQHSTEEKEIDNTWYSIDEKYCWEATEQLLVKSYGLLKN